MDTENLNEELVSSSIVNKWKAVLDESNSNYAPIKGAHRRRVTAQLLENTVFELKNNRSMYGVLSEAPSVNVVGGSDRSATAGAVDYVDPVLISMIRRAAPQLMPFDMMGVQPMKSPTGLVFALRARYGNQGAEALFNEANTAFTGIPAGANTNAPEYYPNGQVGGSPNQLVASNSSNWSGYTYKDGLRTSVAENMGAFANNDFPEMSFSVERVPVYADTRKIKGSITNELLQDLKAQHGLDGENELLTVLEQELIAEINRHSLRAVNSTATIGAQTGVATAGTFDLDVDSNGRWMNEKFQGLGFQLLRESTEIQYSTRRGGGNVLIASQNLVNALSVAGQLDTSALKGTLSSTGITENTFAGTLGGKIKVYVDPYFVSQSGEEYATMGYVGATSWDSGIYYCPYTPMMLMRAPDPQTFNPMFAYATRYAMAANPFATAAADGQVRPDSKNRYYRRVNVTNLM